VILSTLIFLIVISTASLFFIYQADKQKIITQKTEQAKNLLLVAESVRKNMIKKWDDGVFTTQQLNNYNSISNANERLTKILATVRSSNSYVFTFLSLLEPISTV
jgi:type II secretory pathway pseudopilin PulG